MLLGRPDAGLENAGACICRSKGVSGSVCESVSDRMIDNFAIAVTHGLLLLAAWRLLSRPDLDDDAARPGDGSGWPRFARKPGGDGDA